MSERGDWRPLLFDKVHASDRPSFSQNPSAPLVRAIEGRPPGRALDVANAGFQERLYQFIAWHEDVFVWGPPLAELRATVQGKTVAHVEMMQAMAGQHDARTRQRHMESAFNVNRGRPRMLVFTHQDGAAWDVITLDAWNDWRQRSCRSCNGRQRRTRVVDQL